MKDGTVQELLLWWVQNVNAQRIRRGKLHRGSPSHAISRRCPTRIVEKLRNQRGKCRASSPAIHRLCKGNPTHLLLQPCNSHSTPQQQRRTIYTISVSYPISFRSKKMAGKFEPKVPVNLAPPKDDPITLEELAKADGKLLLLSVSLV